MSLTNRQSMGLFRLCFGAFAFLGAVSMPPHAVHTQQALQLNDVYGRGIHAYFANQTSQADELFSQVIQAGSTDPRVYYFRAMARLRNGRQDEAFQDMRVGAAYEARDPGAAGAVGQALMRIQGADRHVLEQYRRQGRLLRAQERTGPL